MRQVGLNMCLLGGGMVMLGAIEAGGTKFVCAVGDETGKIIERIQVPTSVPEETIFEGYRIF